ncbi:MAG: class I SAM-dependent methyltransferase [Actinomycetota bacterium]
MSFDLPATSYDRFMGRYSAKLAPPFCEFAAIRVGQRVLDVGCGPGALTGELIGTVGHEAVTAVDPSGPFVTAARSRYPGVDVWLASAEELPFSNGMFDATCAQLVVHFMADPVAGLAEMARVTRPAGRVVASVWDHAGDRSPISAFWQAAREIRPEDQDESGLAGARRGHLSELFGSAGIDRTEEAELTVRCEHESFDDWWAPFTLGVGPAGAYARTLGDEELASVRDRCRQLLGDGPFTLTATAWIVRGRA